MLSYKDFIGKNVGKLHILGRKGTAKNRTPLLECLCDCGNIVIVQANHIMHRHTESCGCKQKQVVSEISINNLIGLRFGLLVVTALNSRRTDRGTHWDCICDCGNLTTVYIKNIMSGNTRSCGCLRDTNRGLLYPATASTVGYCALWSNKDFKNAVFYRDNHICQNPYCYKISNTICIHHIDYDKQNCISSNLITLCGSCNARANKDRKWHTEWYQTIMSKKFNYRYYKND